jgi:hypothetical protein
MQRNNPKSELESTFHSELESTFHKNWKNQPFVILSVARLTLAAQGVLQCAALHPGANGGCGADGGSGGCRRVVCCWSKPWRAKEAAATTHRTRFHSSVIHSLEAELRPPPTPNKPRRR